MLARRNARTLLGYLFLAIGRFRAPRIIRSDNEAIFKSVVIRTIVGSAGIGQRFTVPGCPWMNGRIERLFGTLKQSLDKIEVDSREALSGLLGAFRFWYNSVRAHQNLGVQTPGEAWHGIDPYANSPK